MQVVVRSVKSNEQQATSKTHDLERSVIETFLPDRDVFRAGTVMYRSEVQMIQDHSPGKLNLLLAAYCGIHIPLEKTILHDGDFVDVFLI